MLKINNVSLRFGTRTLFENVNLEFKDDNCYGIIGANGAGKSTFLKIISGEVESTKGEVIIGKNERISVLRQNHNEFDEYKVIDTVISGDTELYDIMKEKEAIYMKPDFSMEDGIRAGELEAKFEEKNGWQAESDAAILLAGLGLDNSCNDKFMSELEDKEKVIARIHQAAKYIPLDRLCLSPQCGFASCEIGNKLTEEEQWKKLALVKEIAEEVWR